MTKYSLFNYSPLAWRKFLLFAAIFAAVLLISLRSVSAQTVDENVAALLAEDQTVTAADLGVTDQHILAGGQQGWWRRFTQGLRLALTLNQETKAERYLQRAQERLAEAQNALTSQDPATRDAAAGKLARWENDLANAAKRLARFSFEGKDTAKTEALSEWLFDHQLKSQKLLDDLTARYPDLSERLNRVKLSSLSAAAQLIEIEDEETTSARLLKVADRQPGSALRHLKSLEIIATLRDAAPADRRDGLDQALTRLKQKLVDEASSLGGAEETAQLLPRYLAGLRGNNVRHLALLEELIERDDLTTSLRESVLAAREEKIDLLRQQLSTMSETEKQRMLKHLGSGELAKFKVLNTLRERLSSVEAEELKLLRQEALAAFKEKWQNAATPAAKQELLRKLDAGVKDLDLLDELAAELSAEDQDALVIAKNEVVEKIKTRLETASVEQRGQLLKSLAGEEPRHLEVLRRVANQVPDEAKEVIERVIAASEERLQERIEAISDKNELQKIRERAEALPEADKIKIQKWLEAKEKRLEAKKSEERPVEVKSRTNSEERLKEENESEKETAGEEIRE